MISMGIVVINSNQLNYEWERATRAQIKEYTESLSNILDSIKLSENLVLCKDKLCSCELHKFQIDEMCSKIVCACLDASVDIIPMNAHNKKNNENKLKVPFWKEIVQPCRENAIFWHNIWCDNGRPHEGLIANIRRSTRALYHKAIRDVCNNEKILKRQRMAECITKYDTGSRNLWVELKKVKQNSNGIIANSLDGALNYKEIANSLGNKYNTLYHSAITDSDTINNLSNEMYLRCKYYKDMYTVTARHIAEAVKGLKKGKTDGNTGFCSDHVINGGPKLFTMLSILFQSMLVHGYTPKLLLKSVIISIPKNLKGNLSNSDNYRGITLCNSLCKLFDLIIINIYI